MKSVAKMRCALALVIGGILAAGPVMADNQSSAGYGKGGKGGKDERRDRRDHDEISQRDRDGHSAQKGRHFEDRHRVIVREYYVEDFRGGRCPPGLRKRQNGCVPPGQAKKWQVGRPLPREVIFPCGISPGFVSIPLASSTSLDASYTSDSEPPITPASDNAPFSSQTKTFDDVSLRALPSSVVSFSPSFAERVMIFMFFFPARSLRMS